MHTHTHTHLYRYTQLLYSNIPLSNTNKKCPMSKILCRYQKVLAVVVGDQKTFCWCYLLYRCFQCFINLFITRVKVNNHQYFSSHFPPSSLSVFPAPPLFLHLCVIVYLTDGNLQHKPYTYHLISGGFLLLTWKRIMEWNVNGMEASKASKQASTKNKEGTTTNGSACISNCISN